MQLDYQQFLMKLEKITDLRYNSIAFNAINH